MDPAIRTAKTRLGIHIPPLDVRECRGQLYGHGKLPHTRAKNSAVYGWKKPETPTSKVN